MRRVDSISFYVRTEETAREFAVASRTRPLAVKRVGSKIVLCRPFGTRPICRSYPALPCRAIGCSVPAGLLSLRHLSMALQVSMALQAAEGFAIRRDRRGLKPVIFSIVIARLKPCPDTKRSIFRAPNAASRSKVKFSRRFFNPYPSRNVTFSAASGSVPFQNCRLARRS